MMLLFFILAGCAVKCGESQTFVVQMPSNDKLQPNLQLYWNVPTKQCRSKKILFDNLDRFGIIQNKDDRFRGEEVTILYDPGYFPALLRNETSHELKFRNGGVPQEGDLDLHLKSFAGDLKMSIPDSNFSGVGIIDFESWRPIFRQNFGEVLPYQSVSIDIERKRHWWLPEKMVREKARERFEEAARLFMQYTIVVAQRLRPLARWGYYGFPYCFNTVQSNMREDCPGKVTGENDQIKWLWANSTALYPSVYSRSDMSTGQLIQRVRGRVREAARVRTKRAPILPYFSFRYRDEGYFTETDLNAVLKTIAASEAAGLMIWGSSNDVNTIDKCQKLHDYIYNVFGPIVAKYTKKHHRRQDQTTNDNDDDYLTDNGFKDDTNNTVFDKTSANGEDTLTTLNPITETKLNQPIDLETSNFTVENITKQSTYSSTDNPVPDNENHYTTNFLKASNDTSTMFILANKINDNSINITTLEPVTESLASLSSSLETSTYESTTLSTTAGLENLDSISTTTELENSTYRSDNLGEDNDFTTKYSKQDSNETTEKASHVNIEQITGWAYIFGTILSILNDTIDDSDNNTILEPEFSDSETSTYLETDLLMNNLSDFTHMISETTENIVTSASTEVTEANDYIDLKTTTLMDLDKTINVNNEDDLITDSIKDSTKSSLVKNKTDSGVKVEVATKNPLVTDDTSMPESFSTENTTKAYESTEEVNTEISYRDEKLLRQEQNITKEIVYEYTNTNRSDSEDLSTTELVPDTKTSNSYEDKNNIINNNNRSKDLLEKVDLTSKDKLEYFSSMHDNRSMNVPEENIIENNTNLSNLNPKRATNSNNLTLTSKFIHQNQDENDGESTTKHILDEDGIAVNADSLTSEKTIKQVTGSAAPPSRLKYIFCVILYFSISKCLCDYYGECELL